ncbi:hypothetical protein ACSFE6_15480 [Pseudomonas baetica]|uniref:hypothetical protein n=1 Tax=Pseudomonas baetica TaxID=674054 RepID=UPI003EEA1766
MSVKVERLSNQREEQWSVCFGGRNIQFRDEQSARDYAATLKERIEAPHALPEEVVAESAIKLD